VVRSEPSCWWIPQLQQKKPVQRKILDSRGRSFCCCNQGHQKGLGSVCPLQSSLMAPIYEMFSVLSLRIAHVLTHTIYLFAQMTCSYLVDKSFMLIPLYKYAEPPPPHTCRVSTVTVTFTTRLLLQCICIVAQKLRRSSSCTT
jgi:hypothetical protein